MSERKPRVALTELGKAYRIRDAAVRSGWDTYRGAIEAAHAGDVDRLVDCLCGRKPLTDEDLHLLAGYLATKTSWQWPQWLADALRSRTDDDYGRLADFVEETGRRRGRRRNEPVHAAARLVKTLHGIRRDVVFDMMCSFEGASGARKIQYKLQDAEIEYACDIVGRETGAHGRPEQVRDLLNREKNRRHRF